MSSIVTVTNYDVVDVQLERMSGGYGIGPYSCIPWGAAGEEPIVSDWSTQPDDDIRRLATISFNVTNNAWSYVADVSLVFSTGEIEPAWMSTSFTERYRRGSVRIPIDQGFRYTLRRTGGWPGTTVSVAVSTTDFATNVSSGHSS